MEEASKFLHSTKPLVMDYALPQDSNNGPTEVVVKFENDRPSNGLKGRKHYQLEENGYKEERSNKQSAVYVEEDELSEIFDQVLLGCKEPPVQTSKTVDLSTLLVSCAQAVAAGDQRTATEQLNQIRRHASSWGDASQRLANVFAIGIETRLAVTGSQLYLAKRASRISAAEKLQAYQVYLSTCPFKKIAMSFANKTISDSGLTSSTIHIIDFGIAYRFQLPIFIKQLSDLQNAPPKLRITRIEYPQSGFRPTERLEETGRRLANYCARFNVPFEFNAIASQNWETYS
ncbi:hypothetical protein L1987_64001 [Smallanthus sonchifolius]|uniref:Uncharacterized protein n=1 Tax=Smallanthus sonchifolius TaxID=185202 RepID=A0ACB9CEW0_9ASTR|nr:hypothetical protein L1987_64001 [Smallanthus sonchifolius]